MAYLTSDITLLIAPVLDALPMGILEKRNCSHHHIHKRCIGKTNINLNARSIRCHLKKKRARWKDRTFSQII